MGSEGDAGTVKVISTTALPLPQRVIELLADTSRAAVFPMPIGAKLAGIVCFLWKREPRLDELDLRVLRTLIRQGALTVERASYLEELSTTVSYLRSLQSVSRSLQGALRLSHTFHLIVSGVQMVFGFDRISIYLVNWEKEAIEGVLECEGYVPPRSIGHLRQPLDAGTSVYADLAHGPTAYRPLQVRRALLEDGTIGPEHLVACLIPLVVRGKVVGILEVGNLRSNRPITEATIAHLAPFASQAAAAIESASLYQNIRTLFLETVSALVAAIDAKDPYTSGHSRSVTHYAVMLAKAMGLSGKEIEQVQYAALLHDVGKIGISGDILNKPGPLDPGEWEIMRKHPEISERIVRQIERMEEVAQMVRSHQERYDGGGYPDGLSGEEIPLGARILAVADAFDAMTSNRPYRRARTNAEALAELRAGAGTQFDPGLVEVFETVMLGRIDIPNDEEDEKRGSRAVGGIGI